MQEMKIHKDSGTVDAVLRNIILALHNSTDIDEVFQEISRTLGIYLHADSCFIARFDETTGTFFPPTKEYRASDDIPSMLQDEPERWIILTELAKKISEFDYPIEFQQIRNLSLPVYTKLDHLGVQSGLGCTIRFQDSCQAVLFIYQAKQKRSWNEFEKDVVQLAADQTAVAIHHAELYEAAETQSKRQEILHQLYLKVIKGIGLEELFNQALETVCQSLNVRFGKIVEKTDDPVKPYIVRAVKGFDPSLIGQKFGPNDAPHTNYTLESRAPVIVPDMCRETRFAPSPLHFEYGITSAISTVIYGETGSPFGVLQADSQEKRPFSQIDTYLMTTVARMTGHGIERIRTEALVQKTEERFRLMADASPNIVWILNPDRTLSYINKTGLEFFNISSLTEFNQDRWRPYVHPDDVEAIREAAWQALENQYYYRTEHRARRADGEYRWLLSTAKPSYLPNGELYGYIGSSTDITDMKQAEQTLLEYQRKLEQSNKELEQFATVASHDMKAPLRKISSFSVALQQTDGEKLSAEGKDYLERIKRSADKMQTLVTDLLILSSVTRQGKPFRPVNLRDVVTEVLTDLEPYKTEVDGAIEVGSMCEIEGDDSLLGQMFQNLIENALKFHRPGIPPVVKVNAHKLPDGQCAIIIQDNGIGLKLEQTNRIFEAFERLHGAQGFEGAGIGLAVVKKIVERHNGTIKIDSTPGEGSTFTIVLPAKQNEPYPSQFSRHYSSP